MAPVSQNFSQHATCLHQISQHKNEDCAKYHIPKTSHGLPDTWALPGGHLEFGESFDTCAKREILEETGLKIGGVRYLTATNSVFEAEGKHYVTIFMAGVVSNGSDQPQVSGSACLLSCFSFLVCALLTRIKILEPEKCSAWEWASWDELKAEGEAQLSAGSNHTGRELFLPLLSLIEQRPEFGL